MMRYLILSFMLAVGNAALAAPPESMQYGRSYLAEGQPIAAAKSFAALLRLNPADPVVLNNLGVAKAAAGDYQAALNYLGQAQKLAPHRADIQENLVNLREWAKTYGGTAESQALADNLPPQEEPPALWRGFSKQAAEGSRTRRSATSTCTTKSCK